MSVFLCLPSKRPLEESEPIFQAWKDQGYKIAVMLDPSPYDERTADHVFRGPYLGYPKAINFLAGWVLANEPDCDWIVAAGDDTLPDPNKRADEIARECSDHFLLDSTNLQESNETFGVMQPTGDPWADRTGRIIERIAGSPWLGREWCTRMPHGPLWPNFYHCWADETLQIVAQKLGVFWQRPDLTHLHQHWARPRGYCPTCKVEGSFMAVEGHRGLYSCPQCHISFFGERIGQLTNQPEYARAGYTPEQTTIDKAEFDRLKAGGFAECIPS